MEPPQRFVRLKDFIALMGWSRSTFYNRLANNMVPKPQSNGPRTKGYYTDKVAEIQKALGK